MKCKKLMGIAGFCILMLLSGLSLEAGSGETVNTSSGIIIGYNPADFTSPDYPELGQGMMNMVITELNNFRCPNDSSKVFTVVESENPRMREILEKEINLSQSRYADPATRLTRRFLKANHLVKGEIISNRGRISIDLRIEDRQGNVKAQAKVTGAESNFYDLIDEAARSLGDQSCKPDPKEDKKDKENNETKQEYKMDACTRLWKAYYDCIGDGGKDAQGYARGIACGQQYMPQLQHCNPTEVTMKAMESEFDDMPDMAEVEAKLEALGKMLNGESTQDSDNAQSDAEFEQMANDLDMYTK